MPFVIHSWPRAILHVDGDAFFASCEQSRNPLLKGKPVVVGRERGIVVAVSYEAKRLGVQRGMRPFEAVRICPGLVVLPGDYELYSAYSQRMFAILRKYTSDVEEYSIDEAFADITGLRRPLNGSYGDIASRIKNEIESMLRLTVSVGVSLTKVLAKVASKHKKPSGLTLIPGREIETYLTQTSIDKIWGIGPNTSNYLRTLGVVTAYDFAVKPIAYIRKIGGKNLEELWLEMRGTSVHAIDSRPKTEYQTMSQTRTFEKPTEDEAYIFAQLIRNLEGACARARQYHFVASKLSVFLKEQTFKIRGLDLELNRASAMPSEIAPLVREVFAKIFVPGRLYRTTGVTLAGLKDSASVQRTLFEPKLQYEKLTELYGRIDDLNAKYGRTVVNVLSSQKAR